MEKKIIKALDNLTVDQTERLLDDNMEMKISDKECERIKNAVYKKVASKNNFETNKTVSKTRYVKLLVFTRAAAAILIVALLTGVLILKKDSIFVPTDPTENASPTKSASPTEKTPGTVSGTYKKWEYMEYENFVVLTNYDLNQNLPVTNTFAQTDNAARSVFTATKLEAKPKFQKLINTASSNENTITIPDVINGKPVTDISEACFTSIRKQSMDSKGNFYWKIFWDIPEDSPYFSIEKKYQEDIPQNNEDRDDSHNYKYDLQIALYNKNKTKLYCVQDDIDPNHLDNYNYMLPKTVTEIYDGAFMSQFSAISIEYGNENFVIEDNMLLTRDKTRFLTCAVKYAPVMSYNLPDSVIKIDEGAFFKLRTKMINYKYVQETVPVELPEGITEIPDYTFSWSCAAPTKIPQSVERIGDYALAFTGNQSIEIPSKVREIGEDVFGFYNGPFVYGLPFYSQYKYNMQITIDAKNQLFAIENNVLYNKDKTELITGKNDAFFSGYQLPETIRLIHFNALNISVGGKDEPKNLTLVIPKNFENFEIYYQAILLNGTEENSITIYGKPGSCAERFVEDYNNWYSQYNNVNHLIKFLPLQE